MGEEELSCLSDKGEGYSGYRDWQLRPVVARTWCISSTCRRAGWT